MFNIQVLKKGRKYINDPLLRGLVSYWKLNEGSGTRADSVGGNNLTDNNTVGRVMGKQSGAGNFIRANSEYLSIASNLSLQTGDIDFTFCGWIYPLSLDSSGNDIITKINIGESSNFEYFIQVYNNSGGYFRFRCGTGDIFFAETGIQVNQWAFFVCWHNSVENTINYQINNGTIRTAAHVSGTTANDRPFNIGAGTLDRYFDGYIDEVGFWKRVLSDEEKTRLYNSGNGITYPFNSILDRLVSYWAMEQTSGTRTDSNLANNLIDNNTVGVGSGIVRNGAVFMTANSESLNAPSATLFTFGDTDFTIAAWVYLDSKASSMLIASKYNSDSVREYLLQYVSANDNFRFITYDGLNLTGSVSSSAGVSTGRWYFVVAYHDAINNLVGISIDGETPATSATTGVVGNTASLFFIGNREGGAAQYWDGKIDEVGVWAKVLSTDDIKYLYNNGKGKTYPLSSPMSQV